jgi:hypothetical protein
MTPPSLRAERSDPAVPQRVERPRSKRWRARRGRSLCTRFRRPARERLNRPRPAETWDCFALLAMTRGAHGVRAQRDLLLPKLISGEIGLSEAARLREAAE